MAGWAAQMGRLDSAQVSSYKWCSGNKKAVSHEKNNIVIYFSEVQPMWKIWGKLKIWSGRRNEVFRFGFKMAVLSHRCHQSGT